jgi:hypothetical protein
MMLILTDQGQQLTFQGQPTGDALEKARATLLRAGVGGWICEQSDTAPLREISPLGLPTRTLAEAQAIAWLRHASSGRRPSRRSV